MRKYVKNGFNCAYTADAIKVCLCFDLGCSNPPLPTRRWMRLVADARTGRKAYADCRRDCRITGLNIQRGLREVNTLSRHPHQASIRSAIGWYWAVLWVVLLCSLLCSFLTTFLTTYLIFCVERIVFVQRLNDAHKHQVMGTTKG